MSYIPKGCDQQGRVPEALDDVEAPEHDMLGTILIDVVTAVIVLGAVGAGVVWLIGG